MAGAAAVAPVRNVTKNANQRRKRAVIQGCDLMVQYLTKAEVVSTSEDVNMPEEKKHFISVGDFEKEIQEYKQLVFKGRMMDFIVAFILGAALNNVAKSISENLIMPIVSYALNHTGQNWEQMICQPLPGLKLEIGKFSSTCISFALIAIIMFAVWAFMRHFYNPERKLFFTKILKIWHWVFPYKLVPWKEEKPDPVPKQKDPGVEVNNITTLP